MRIGLSERYRLYTVNIAVVTYFFTIYRHLLSLRVSTVVKGIVSVQESDTLGFWVFKSFDVFIFISGENAFYFRSERTDPTELPGYGSMRTTVTYGYHISITRSIWKNVGPIRHYEPPHAACFTLPFTRCRYCRTPPAHRCPQQQRRRRQRQRVTEGTNNGPNNWSCGSDTQTGLPTALPGPHKHSITIVRSSLN